MIVIEMIEPIVWLSELMVYVVLAGVAQSSGSLPPPPWEVQSADNSQPAGAQFPQPVQVTQGVVAHSQPISNGSYPLGLQNMGNGQPSMGGHFFSMGGHTPQPFPGVYSPQPVPGGFSPQPVQGGYAPQPVPGGYAPQPVPGGYAMAMHPQQMQSGHAGVTYPQQMYGNQMAGYGYGYGSGQQQNAMFLNQQMSGLSLREDVSLRNSSYQGGATPSYVHPGKPKKQEDKLFGDLVDIAKFKPTNTTPGKAGTL